MEWDNENQDLWEESPRSKRFLRILASLLFLLALLYFSGIYQGTFFRRTPSTVPPVAYEQIVEGETYTIPLRVYIISGDGRFGIRRDEENIRTLVSRASDIWRQAGVALEFVGIVEIEMSDEEVVSRLNNSSLGDVLPSYDRSAISAILTHTLWGLNGVAFIGSDTIAVAEYTTGYDFRTLAHEVGHVLGLGHVPSPSSLMNSGGTGTVLDMEEASHARARAELFNTAH